MKKVIMKVSSILLATALSMSLFTGCNKKDNSTKESTTTGTSAQTAENKSNKISEKPITLTYWVSMDANSSQVLSSYADMEMYKQMEKLSNIKIEFKHPPAGQSAEQFNLMIASRDLPDIIEHAWGSYAGGPEKAISDNIIIKLNDLVDKNAPNFKKLLDTNSSVNKQSRTDEKSLYSFPSVGLGHVKTTTGPLIRKDWLDELGLKVPETIDEWTEVLTRFKEKKGATAPITGTSANFNSDIISGAFGVNHSYYLDNGKVKYGPMEPAFKKYLELMRSWYKAGLLDPDFAANNAKAMESKVVNGKAGVIVSGGIGGTLGYYMSAMKTKDPKFNMVALQFPVLKKGDSPMFTQRAWEVRTTAQLAITSNNKYPAETARWADYFFSDEGNLLKNFGVEGLTYKLENGYPKYTDLIMKNPEGLSVNNAIGKYFRASTPSPGFIDSRYHEQYMDLPQQKEAYTLWAKVSDNSLKVYMPSVTATQKETEESSSINTTIDSYQKEMFVKFVMGTESLDNFDKYLEQINKMNVKRAIELKQAALDRYNKR